MNWLKKWLRSLLEHNKTAISTIGASIVVAGVTSIQSGHFDKAAVINAALTTVAGIAKSALPSIGNSDYKPLDSAANATPPADPPAGGAQ